MAILVHFLSFILLIVVIVHYIDAKPIRILTANSHLIGHSDLSAFSYKTGLLKKVLTNRSLFGLLIQTTFWNTEETKIAVH